MWGWGVGKMAGPLLSVTASDDDDDDVDDGNDDANDDN